MDLLTSLPKQLQLLFFVPLAASAQYCFTDRLSAAIYREYWVPICDAQYYRQQGQQSRPESVDIPYDADAEKGRTRGDEDSESNTARVRQTQPIFTQSDLDANNNAHWGTLCLFWLMYELAFCATLGLALSCEIDLPGFILGLAPLFVPYKFYRCHPGKAIGVQGVWIVICIYWGHPFLERFVTAVVS